MPLPRPTSGMPGGLAAQELGLGDMLANQVKDETDEQRRKRMAEIQQRGMMPGGLPTSMSIFGGMGGLG